MLYDKYKNHHLKGRNLWVALCYEHILELFLALIQSVFLQTHKIESVLLEKWHDFHHLHFSWQCSKSRVKKKETPGGLVIFQTFFDQKLLFFFSRPYGNLLKMFWKHYMLAGILHILQRTNNLLDPATPDVVKYFYVLPAW